MLDIEVLKFGSSVLRSASDLNVAVDEIYRRLRSNCRVLAVVSAFEGVTDQLLEEASKIFGIGQPGATASYLARGEQRTAARLLDRLIRCGIPARVVEPREIRLVAAGSSLDSAPQEVDAVALDRFWQEFPVLVMPGFYGVDALGHTMLFGRGGSDLSALFLAGKLRARCRLLKDVDGVYDADPAGGNKAHRYASISWATALKVAGPLIQSKALLYAQSRAIPFSVARPNEAAGTLVGEATDEWSEALTVDRPLRVVLLGCGVVGRGVYENLKGYPEVFELCHVVVRDIENYTDIDERTSDRGVVSDSKIDVVVDCIGGGEPAFALISAALKLGQIVVTANKLVILTHWQKLAKYARGPRRQLWFSAAAGGVQGAGRWPTAVAVLGDLHEAARQAARLRGQYEITGQEIAQQSSPAIERQ